jgi:hypothetical protein
MLNKFKLLVQTNRILEERKSFVTKSKFLKTQTTETLKILQIKINQQIFKTNFSMLRTIKLTKTKMPASSNIQEMEKLKMVLLRRGKMVHKCQIRHNRWKVIKIAKWKIVKFRINKLKKLRKMKKSCQSIITTCRSKRSIIMITITKTAVLKRLKGRTSSQNQPNSLASRPHCKARTKSSTTFLNNNPPTPPRTSPLVPSTTTSSMNRTSKSRDNSNINKSSSPFQANFSTTKTRC